MTYEQGPPAVTIPGEYDARSTAPASASRRAYSWSVIALSFLMLWIAPVLGGDQIVNYAMLACLAICVWDAPACLFLVIASAGAYLVKAEEGFKITPTEVVGMVLLVRCLISPGLGGVVAFLASTDRWVKGMLALYAIGIYGTAMLRQSVFGVASVTTGFVTFLIVGTLARRIGDWRRIVIPLTAGLLLPAAYYLLIWGRVLRAATTYLIADRAELRVSSGRDDPNYMGSLMAPCFVILLSFVISGKGLWRRMAAFGGVCLCFLGCLETGSRGALVVMFLGAVCAAVFALKTRGFWAIGGSFLLVVLGGAFSILAKGLFEGKLLQVFERFSQRSTRPVWTWALDFVVSHPIGDPAGWAAEHGGIHAHQTFLQAGLDGGYIGLIGLGGTAILSIAGPLRYAKFAPLKDRFWILAGSLAMLSTTLSLCAISTVGHKVMWALFAICGLSAHLTRSSCTGRAVILPSLGATVPRMRS